MFGFLSGAWMCLEGDWKLVKYAADGGLLFNVREDPQEQHNRIDDPACQEAAQRLDKALTAEAMRSVTAGQSDKIVAHIALYSDEAFGRPDWKQQYPQKLS